MDLTEIRKQIDSLDKEIVALMEKRMQLVDQVAAYKQETGKAIFDPEREQVLLAKVANLVEEKSYQATIVSNFESMMAHSRAYQSQKLGKR